jgi:hypothetical protein
MKSRLIRLNGYNPPDHSGRLCRDFEFNKNQKYKEPKTPPHFLSPNLFVRTCERALAHSLPGTTNAFGEAREPVELVNG